MTVIIYELNDESNYEEIGRHSGEDTVENDELLSIWPEEVWQDESDEWVSERLDGPYIMAAIQDEEPERTDKISMWTEYVGPDGGTGYQHILTDEVRYVDDEPTTDEAPGNQVDVDEPDEDELTGYSGISDGSYIRDNLPVTATFTDTDGDTKVGQIEEAEVGGFNETFVIAASDGRRYEVEGDNLTGYIEPTPEYNPDSDEEDSRIRDEFERTKEELPDGVIPERPVPNMGNGGSRPERDQFRHIGTGRVTDEHVELLQDIVETGDTGNIQVGIAAVGDDVDYGPWDTDAQSLSYFDGGQFANIDVEMPIEDFLATQTDMLSSDRNHPQEAYESFHRVRIDDVEEYAEVLQNEPGEMPMPYIEFGRNGNMRNQQEGRHRALAARMAGFDTLPVRFAINAERDGKGSDDRVDWGQDLDKSLEKGNWRPYYGPKGGEGWIYPSSFGDDRIVYEDEPPGEVNGAYEEDYWEDRPTPADPELGESIASFLDDAKPRSHSMDDPAADFIESAIDAGYEPYAVQQTMEWYLKSRDAYVGDGTMEESDINRIVKSASTEYIDRHTSREVEIEGGKRGGGSISLGRIDNDFKRDWWEKFESEIGYTDEQLTNEKPAYSAIRNWSMTSQMYSSSTAPLLKAAIQESNNDFIPVNGDEVRETEVTNREIEHVLEYQEAVTELYREVYGDKVPCFRGIDGESSQIEDLKEDIRDGKAVELPEATLSSWATEPSTAIEFAGTADRYESEGVVIRQEVPVEHIFVTGDTHPGLLSNENELVVNAPEPVTRYDGDQLFEPSETTTLEQAQWAIERANRDTDVSEEAAKVVQRALHSKQDVNQYSSIAIENHDWFRQVAGDRESEEASKAWIPYEGPRGGEGWQNTEDRQDIRYGLDDPPGEIEDGYEDIAEDWGSGEDDVQIPEKFEGEYRPEDITPIPGDPSEWDDEFPISEGQTLLGQNWEWTVENLWFQGSNTHVPEPRMSLAIPTGVSHKFGYVSDSVKLRDMEPGWFKNPAIPSEENRIEFVGVVGEPESRNMSFNPTGEAANASFDLDEAAENMSQAVRDSDTWQPTEAENYAADLLEQHDPSYETMVALARYGLESNGQEVNDDVDINDAEDIVLAGIKKHLDANAPEHPTLRGKLSLGSANDELREDFQSRLTPDTRETVNTAMGEWVKGHGSMVDEYTLPIYRQAAQTYDNDFYPTRSGVWKLIHDGDDVDGVDTLDKRQERIERYRQKTIDTFREVFGDTVPVFRGYNPNEKSNGHEAREALQAEDGPSEIEIRNGVVNSWSTDPTVAHKFSTWTAGDSPGVVVRQQVPVEQIFGAVDTADNVRSDEAELMIGNPKEFTHHNRDDVFLPEEFDPVEQMRWALSGVENDAADEEAKADDDILSLDWEIESVDWMNRYRDMEEALSNKNWTPIDVGDESGYQHVVSGETVVSKAGIPYSDTARQAGHTPLSPVLTDKWTRKAWVPYEGPRGGTGWRNTTTENIRYDVDEKPEPAENDPDELTEENIEEADIIQSFGVMETTADDLLDGQKLQFEIEDHLYETHVQEITDNAIHAVDTETRREIEIPIDDSGEPRNGLDLYAPQPVFIGHGIAGSESSWLPENKEPNQRELEAEALRSAASTDGYGDTSYIEAFAARASEQGAARHETIDAIDNALETHPVLPTELADEIYENGQRLLEIEESLTDKMVARSYPITPIERIQKSWTPQDEIQDTNHATVAVQKQVEAIFKDWIPYEGPQGGEGWQNTLTGEIRYQEGRPTGAGSDADVSVPANATIQTISAAITSVLGATVMQSLKQQATGGGGSLNPQTYVTAAAMFIAQTGKGSFGELQEALNEEAESEPEDAKDVTIQTESGEIISTTQTGVTDVTGAITQVADEQTVARLGMEMSDEEAKNPEAWIQSFGDKVTNEGRENFQQALNERIRERTISTDRFRGGVIVPNDLTAEEVKEAMDASMDAETVNFLNNAIPNNPSVDETDAKTWVKAALTQIGDDTETRSRFQNQFDVSAAVSDDEDSESGGESGVGTIRMEGGGESIEMPTDTTAEDAREAIEETLGQDFLKHTAGFMNDQGAEMDSAAAWVMNGLTLSQIANPEGFETNVNQMQDSLIETAEEEEQDRSTEVINGYDAEGDWQSYVDPITDLLQEGESAGDIVQNLKENAEISGHGLQDEQIRTLAFQAHKEATERNPEGVTETPDAPSLAMDWGNEFPDAMRDRMQNNHPEVFEQLNESFEPWSDDPHSEQLNSFWNHAVQHSGNANIPEMDGRPENVTEEEVEAVERLHQITHDTLTEMYGDTVPLFRPVSGDAASELKRAKEAEDDDIQFTHRPAESWSSDIEQISQRTDFNDEETVVIRREVPTEDVLASSVTGSPGLDPEDNEFVVSSGTETEYQRDDVLTGEDLKDPQATMEQTAWANDTTGGTEQTEANEDPGETVEETGDE